MSYRDTPSFTCADESHPHCPDRAHYTEIPVWAVADTTIRADALAALAFHSAFVNRHLGWHDSRVGSVDLCARYGWSARTQNRGGSVERRTRPDGTPLTVTRHAGPVRALAAAGALTRTPRATRVADCGGCGAATDGRCAPGCTERAGRLEHEPVYTPEQAPPSGWAHAGPMDLGEYYHPERIADRLADPGAREGDTVPYVQVPTWVLMRPGLSPLATAVFVWLCAHVSLARLRLLAKAGRPRIAARFGVSHRTVSRALAELEDIGAVARVTRVQRGDITFGDGRWCHTLVRAVPTEGLPYPHPASPAEWRDEDRLGARVAGHAPRDEDTPDEPDHGPLDPPCQRGDTHGVRGDNPPAPHPPRPRSHPSAGTSTNRAHADQRRTDGMDLVEAVMRTLPAHVRPLARPGDRAMLAGAADARLAEGWTLSDLGACLGHAHDRLTSAWGLMARLADPDAWVPGAFGARVDTPAAGGDDGWCGDCSDPVHRWRYLDPDAETGPYRCTCHHTIGARF